MTHTQKSWTPKFKEATGYYLQHRKGTLSAANGASIDTNQRI